MPQIVHLEDDNPLREIFIIALQSYDPNIECIQFANSNELMEFVDQSIEANDFKAKVFVLDIRVPGKYNGLQVAEKLRELGLQMPIIMTSAYQKPAKSHMDQLQLMWMPKPWHVLNAAQTIAPLAYDSV